MSSRRSLIHLTMLTSLLVSLCGFMITTPTHAYIGEDISINMYRDLNKKYAKVYGGLAERQLGDIMTALDEKTKELPFCKKYSGCFDTGKKFSQSELAKISAGQNGIIFDHLKKDEKGKKIPLTTESLPILQSIIAELTKNSSAELADTIKNLGELSLIGLYTDGSLDNSSYDLAYDLDQIHKVIFADNIPYDGYENESAGGMIDLLGGLFGSANSPEGSASANGNTSTPPASGTGTTTGSGGTTASGGTSNTGSIATKTSCDPTELSNLDDGFFTDINNQITTGGNTNSNTSGQTSNPQNNNTGTGSGNPGSNNTPSSSRSTPRKNKLTDSFPCGTFFCIRVNMIIYQQKLLGGMKKTYTVESILDENLKISDKFSGTSLAQTKMTKNFFQLSFKNINLPRQVHIGVMVASMPVPLLNVEKDPADKLNKKSEETPAEIIKKTFQDKCMDVKQPNKLFLGLTKDKYLMEKSAELTSEDFATKQREAITCDSGPASYSQFMNDKFRNDYYASFNNDLLEFRSFSTKMRESLNNVIDVIKLLYAKK